MSTISKPTEQKHLLVSALIFDGGKSGLSEYTRQLSYAFCAHRPISMALLRKDIKYFDAKHTNLTVIPISNIFANPIMSIVWHVIVLPFLLLDKKFEALILPAINRRMGVWYPKPTIGIAHDLSQFSISNKYGFFRTFYVKNLLPRLLGSLNHIVAISENTRRDLIHYWHVDERIISVKYNGYDTKRFNECLPDTATDTLKKYGIDQPYLIYVSRIEHPGKNHVRLLEAFDQLEPQIANNKLLIFVGNDWNGSAQVRQYASRMKRTAQIRFLGFVPTEELPSLYHHAELLVFPSLYEGFGIPLVEAMACGTPCACSNNSSLGEIAGDAAFTFSPSSVNSIKNALTLALSNPSAAAIKKDRARRKCYRFSWPNLAAHIDSKISELKPCKSTNTYLKPPSAKQR